VAAGMDVVYKAEDIKLHRFVAPKFLPDSLAKDHQALERFQREPQATSHLTTRTPAYFTRSASTTGQPTLLWPWNQEGASSSTLDCLHRP
jgi:serine/threonine protein kinase